MLSESQLLEQGYAPEQAERMAVDILATPSAGLPAAISVQRVPGESGHAPKPPAPAPPDRNERDAASQAPRGFRNIRAKTTIPAAAPKPGKPWPGRRQDRRTAAPHPATTSERPPGGSPRPRPNEKCRLNGKLSAHRTYVQGVQGTFLVTCSWRLKPSALRGRVRRSLGRLRSGGCRGCRRGPRAGWSSGRS